MHSHPYGGEHEHSGKGLETIFFLSILNTFGDAPSSITPLLWLFLLGTILVPALSGKPKAVNHGVISLRAPPALL